MGMKFENENMPETTFCNVNLRRSRFEDVNLSDSTITNVNLSNVRIDDANIHGLTIFGFRIDELINLEFNRRDPERKLLHMKDVYDPEEMRRVMAELDKLRERFRGDLGRVSAEQQCKRPGARKWSAIEHVRHLIFAEDLYINRWILQNDEPFSHVELLPDFLKEKPVYADVGTETCNDLERLFDEWERIHQSTQTFVGQADEAALRRDTRDVDFGQGTVGIILEGMAYHDLHHIQKARLVAGITR